MHSNKYHFIYAAVMTVIVAILLSLAATGLKPLQDKNIALEKKTNILTCVIGSSITEKSGEEIEATFDQRISEAVVNNKGEKVEGIKAFDVDVLKEAKKPVEERLLPVYTYKNDDGSKYFIMPVVGNGLWGPIWGFIALEADLNTVVGASFGHKAETPGLGAEITTDWFTGQFSNEKLLNQNGEYALTVLKGRGNKKEAQPNFVDGVSGATVTSRGAHEMLENGYKNYKAYFNSL